MGPFDFVNTAFFDTSGNDFAEPRDALLVINFLNASAESVRAGPAARPILVTGDTLPLGQLTPALFVEQQRKTSDNEQDLAAEGEALLLHREVSRRSFAGAGPPPRPRPHPRRGAGFEA